MGETDKLKMTRNRRLVMSALENADEPLSADDIFHVCDENIPLSSLYRILCEFCSKELVVKAHNGDSAVYRRRGTHEHLIHCSICSSDFPIPECPIDFLRDEIERSTGFVITDHKFTVSGICPHCQNQSVNQK